MNFTPMSDRDLAIFMHQLANLMSHRNFIAALSDQTHRFPDAPFMAQVSEKGARDVIGSIRYFIDIPLEEARELRVTSDPAVLTDAFAQCAQQLRSIADRIYPEKLTQKETRFSIPRGQSFVDVTNELFGYDLGESARLTLNRLGNPSSELYRSDVRTAYLTDIIFWFGVYFRCRATLTQATGHDGYESILAYAVSQGADFWLRGYPNDLLVHDINVILAGGNATAIAMKTDVLSTYTVMKDGDPAYWRHYPKEYSLSRPRFAAA